MTPTFGLIIIGDEIMSGKRQDKHMPKVIEFMNARGLGLSWAEYVGDVPERITAALRRAFASGDAVFSCGGIGATPDDIMAILQALDQAGAIDGELIVI